MEEQNLNWKTRLSSNFQQYLRVWRLLKKPTKQEFLTIAKVSAIGLLIVGAFGFAIATIMSFFF
jgi:protein transport protein SEC61 subunit gamma-like protein